ncbi:hypothetical protein SCHPADRAFT_944208 [Schizopora paradoxa]|uniref:Uncharacterized protein n=1 Tax=Schizopora paradoxa TaxID=27342 RepID=A0A0H2RVA3_9AGAM|nr:hypothetical protein SCHPADRAFT_944208 [Schizopora paradoxa]
MSSTAFRVPSSSSQRETEKKVYPTVPLASTLDVVQFDPGNAVHCGKAPDLFRIMQGQFADAALAGTADVYSFQDECVFFGTVVHDPVAGGGESGRAIDNTDVEMDPDLQQTSRFTRAVGFFYIHSSPASNGEMNIGLSMDSRFDVPSCKSFVVYKVLHMIFNIFKCRRAQVAIIEDGKKSRIARDLFISMGFVIEGIKRMSVFSPLHYSLRDVVYLAMLDTEWLFKRYDSLGASFQPKTAWDEMLDRHNKEREDLLLTEEGHSLKRSSSAETIRVAMTECGASATESSSINGGDSDAASQAGGSQRRASVSSQPDNWNTAHEPHIADRLVNPFTSNLDGTESSFSWRQNPFEPAAGDDNVSWASVVEQFSSRNRDLASAASPPPASSVHSYSGAGVDDHEAFPTYEGGNEIADGRALLRKMMEESLSGQGDAVAGPSKVREWLASTNDQDLLRGDTGIEDNDLEDHAGRRNADDEGMVDSDYGVISDDSMEKEESGEEWEVLSGES